MPQNIWELNGKVSSCHVQAILEKGIEVVVQAFSNCVAVTALRSAHKRSFTTKSTPVDVYSFHLD